MQEFFYGEQLSTIVFCYLHQCSFDVSVLLQEFFMGNNCLKSCFVACTKDEDEDRIRTKNANGRHISYNVEINR